MKKLKNVMPAILLVLTLGCSSSEDNPMDDSLVTPSISQVTDITKDGFTVSLVGAFGNQIEVGYADNESFQNSQVVLVDPEQNQVTISGLQEATAYYLRVRSISDSQQSDFSVTTHVNTLLSATEISITTTDNLALSASIRLPEGTTSMIPLVVFCHSAGASQAEWLGDNSIFLKKLLDNGYGIFTFDNRNHGQSEDDPNVSNISGLLDDPDRLPTDIAAMNAYISSLAEIDQSRIAIIGSSMGANLACVAIGTGLNFKVGVSLSPRTTAVDNMGGGSTNLSLQGIYFIAAENDQGGDRETYANQLFTRTADPSKITIVTNSDAHGSFLVAESEIDDLIVQWLDDQL